MNINDGNQYFVFAFNSLHVHALIVAAINVLAGQPFTQTSYINGCTALPVFSGTHAVAPLGAATAVNGTSNVPYTGFLVAGFGGFCPEDHLKELIGR